MHDTFQNELFIILPVFSLVLRKNEASLSSHYDGNDDEEWKRKVSMESTKFRMKHVKRTYSNKKIEDLNLAKDFFVTSTE